MYEKGLVSATDLQIQTQELSNLKANSRRRVLCSESRLSIFRISVRGSVDTQVCLGSCLSLNSKHRDRPPMIMNPST